MRSHRQTQLAIFRDSDVFQLCMYDWFSRRLKQRRYVNKNESFKSVTTRGGALLYIDIFLFGLHLQETGRKEGNVLFNDALEKYYLWYMAREETRFRHAIGYSFRLAARDLSYAPSYRLVSAYHGLCYTSCGALT